MKLLARSTERGTIVLKASGPGVLTGQGDLPADAVITTQWVNSNLECWEGR